MWRRAVWPDPHGIGAARRSERRHSRREAPNVASLGDDRGREIVTDALEVFERVVVFCEQPGDPGLVP